MKTNYQINLTNWCFDYHNIQYETQITGSESQINPWNMWDMNLRLTYLSLRSTPGIWDMNLRSWYLSLRSTPGICGIWTSDRDIWVSDHWNKTVIWDLRFEIFDPWGTEKSQILSHVCLVFSREQCAQTWRRTCQSWKALHQRPFPKKNLWNQLTQWRGQAWLEQRQSQRGRVLDHIPRVIAPGREAKSLK